MFDILKRLIKEEEGQGMIEYGLILALIAVIVVGLLASLNEDLSPIFESIGDALGK